MTKNGLSVVYTRSTRSLLAMRHKSYLASVRCRLQTGSSWDCRGRDEKEKLGEVLVGCEIVWETLKLEHESGSELRLGLRPPDSSACCTAAQDYDRQKYWI